LTYENCVDELVEKIKLNFPNAKHVTDADPTDPKNYEEHGNLSKEFLEAQYYFSMEGAVRRFKKIVAERPILTRTLRFLEKVVEIKNSKYEKKLAKPKNFLMNSLMALEKVQDTVENTALRGQCDIYTSLDGDLAMRSPPEQQIAMNVEDMNMIERNGIFYREIDEINNSNNDDNNNDDKYSNNNDNDDDNDDYDTNDNSDDDNNDNNNINNESNEVVDRIRMLVWDALGLSNNLDRLITRMKTVKIFCGPLSQNLSITQTATFQAFAFIIIWELSRQASLIEF
jgi:hypothetical protein